MFEGLKRFWKGFMRMFGYTTLKQIVGKDITLSDNMINAMGLKTGMTVLDCTLGLAADALVSAFVSKCEVIGLEANAFTKSSIDVNIISLPF